MTHYNFNKISKHAKSLLAASITTFALSACGGGSNSSETVTPQPTTFSFSANEMITNLTNDVIVNGYQSLNNKAQAFHLATLTLLNTPTAENLLAAQQAWREVRLPWEQGEAHIFGPVDALSIDPHLDTWPLNTSDLQTLLNNQSGFSADEIKNWNDDVQGFHTMEYLLFGDGVNDNNKDITEMTALEREYLVASAEVFYDHTTNLYNAWTIDYDTSDNINTPYKDLILTPNNNVYSSQLGVIEELINGMIGIVDEVGNGKIAEPFGASITNVDTSKVESQYSWNSLADFTNNIQGVQNVYRGELVAGADKQGIINFVEAADATLASRVDDEINNAIAAITAIAGENNLPFRQAIKDENARLRVQTAIDSLAIVQASLTNDVLPLLHKWQQ